jgi:hypothetical protein
MRRSHTLRLGRALVLVMTVAVMLAAAAGAVPDTVFRDDPRDDNLSGAGLGVEVAVAVDIRVQALARGRDGLVYFRQHVAETDVLPNLANEETVTSSGEGRRHARGLRVSLRHVPG